MYFLKLVAGRVKLSIDQLEHFDCEKLNEVERGGTWWSIFRKNGVNKTRSEFSRPNRFQVQLKKRWLLLCRFHEMLEKWTRERRDMTCLPRKKKLIHKTSYYVSVLSGFVVFCVRQCVLRDIEIYVHVSLASWILDLIYFIHHLYFNIINVNFFYNWVHKFCLQKSWKIRY